MAEQNKDAEEKVVPAAEVAFLGLPNCRHSQSIDKIVAALVKSLPKIGTAAKDAENPHLKNRYADLASIVEVARAPLAEAEIAIMQPPTVIGDGSVISVATILIHSSGQWISTEIRMSSIDKKAQSIGSTITYARRYSLGGFLGIIADDDDGNAATGVTGPRDNNRDHRAPVQQQRSQASRQAAPAVVSQPRTTSAPEPRVSQPAAAQTIEAKAEVVEHAQQQQQVSGEDLSETVNAPDDPIYKEWLDEAGWRSACVNMFKQVGVEEFNRVMLRHGGTKPVEIKGGKNRAHAWAELKEIAERAAKAAA